MCGRRRDCKLLFGANENAEKAVVFDLLVLLLPVI